MGRRSINTTKSGKYMNPTDQARKEARKRELKKNKKQRQMVRAAVLKGKDPLQIIQDMEKIDEMEYSVVTPPLLNEKVLKDKRKKLKETWDRVMRLYSKEDRERYVELKKLEIEYESRRSTLMKYFESVRVTQQVQVDEIPLPSTPDIPLFLTSQIPLPSDHIIPVAEAIQPPHSILKKPSLAFHREGYPEIFKPPGVPAGPPPNLSSDEDDDDDEDIEGVPMDETIGESQVKESKAKSRKIRFADESGDVSENDTSSDSDDDDAEESKETGKADKTDENNEESKTEENEPMDTTEKLPPDPTKIEAPPGIDPEDITSIHQVPLPAGPPPGVPQGPPPMMFRPPPMRPGMPLPPRMLPPGVPPPPPGRPPVPPPGLPLRLGAPPIRLPPGPPPGIPPLRLMRPPPPSMPPPRLLPPGVSSLPTPGQGLQNSSVGTPNTAADAANDIGDSDGASATSLSAPVAVLSAPPSLMQRPKHGLTPQEEAKRAATIEAKPQIRNLSADVMRFTPTTLRVKREDKHKKGPSKGGSQYEPSRESYPSTPVSNPSASAPTKDDAYLQFLLEMEEFL